ncbi:DUF4184 family protein [Streptomyces sp. NPDC090025]|uniref:DUF4184 family protein n=1 Tax=Streptomyces sp. NPDC090025 TaxID=3365922 RepID=UPI003834AB8E
MPFTLSHAAAVLPGIRRNGTARGPLVASALVAGSFAPDMTYFAASVVPGAMRFGNVTHSFPGVATVDVLITATLVALWLLVREPLVALLPRRARGRVYGLVRGRPWRERHPAGLACWFVVSAVIGSLTHVVWDAFTHLDRWGTRLVPVLGEVVGDLPVYLYVQYGSSALALLLLGWCAVRALRAAPARAPLPAGFRTLDRRGPLLAGSVIGAAVVAGAVQRVLRFSALGGRVGSPLDIIPTLCFGAGSGLFLGVLLYAAGMRLWPARPAPGRPDASPPGRTEAAAADRTARREPERSRPGSR